MGTDIRIVIEFDFSRVRPCPDDFAPFDTDDVNVWDLEHDALNHGAKDYRLFSALAGWRAWEDDPPPLFAPRGLPPDVHWTTQKIFEEEDDVCGWLLAHEVRAAIAHLQVPPEHLSASTHILLQVLAAMEAQCGEERVRIVFGFN
jgi:hypothetical protein